MLEWWIPARADAGGRGLLVCGAGSLRADWPHQVQARMRQHIWPAAILGRQWYDFAHFMYT